MDISLSVATYLANNGFGTVGTDIFVSGIPADKQGLYLIRAGGLMANYLPIEETVIDIYAKDTQARSAITKLENLKRFVHRMHNTTLADDYIYTMLILGDVEDVQRDDEYDKVYKLTLQVKHRPLGAIS